MGNEEAKEFICTTHGPELRGMNAGGRGGAGQRAIKRRNKWDNCNSIINKTYLKIKTNKNVDTDKRSKQIIVNQRR